MSNNLLGSGLNAVRGGAARTKQFDSVCREYNITEDEIRRALDLPGSIQIRKIIEDLDSVKDSKEFLSGYRIGAYKERLYWMGQMIQRAKDRGDKGVAQ